MEKINPRSQFGMKILAGMEGFYWHVDPCTNACWGAKGALNREESQSTFRVQKCCFKAFPLASADAGSLYFDFSFSCPSVRPRAFHGSAAGMEKSPLCTHRLMHVLHRL